MIRVQLADDHKMFRQGLRMLFEMEPDISIVGESSTGSDAVQRALELNPDVILMDINMPGLNGVEATREILEQRPEIGVIMLTMLREDEQVFQAIKNGARGYILKDVDSAELIQAVRIVARGESMIDASLATRVLSEFKRMSQQSEQRNRECLTDRELQILTLIAQGMSNKDISAKLFLSEKTVKNYITTIFQKLQLTDRTQAAIYALQKGLIKTD